MSSSVELGSSKTSPTTTLSGVCADVTLPTTGLSLPVSLTKEDKFLTSDTFSPTGLSLEVILCSAVCTASSASASVVELAIASLSASGTGAGAGSGFLGIEILSPDSFTFLLWASILLFRKSTKASLYPSISVSSNSSSISFQSSWSSAPNLSSSSINASA